jgi:hypothetical protein
MTRATPSLGPGGCRCAAHLRRPVHVSMHIPETRWVGRFTTWTMPWICALAVSASVAYAINVALIGATGKGTVVPTSTASSNAGADPSEVRLICDMSTGRMLYVAAVNECVPAEW